MAVLNFFTYKVVGLLAINLLVLIIFFLILSISVTTSAQYSHLNEYTIKAAFMYNFIKYTTWPEDALDSSDVPVIRICVIGQNPFGKALDPLKAKAAKGKKLVVRPITLTKELRKCHILFISNSEKKRVEEIIEALTGRSILTVGDTKGYTEEGVIINFYEKQKKIHFEINIDAAERAGLKISSRVLKLAKIFFSFKNEGD